MRELSDLELQPLELKFASLVTLGQRYAFTKLEVSELNLVHWIRSTESSPSQILDFPISRKSETWDGRTRRRKRQSDGVQRSTGDNSLENHVMLI